MNPVIEGFIYGILFMAVIFAVSGLLLWGIGKLK